MKLRSVLYFLCLLFSAVVVAQDFNAGVLAGVNASQVGGDGYAGFRKAGLLVGLYTNVDVSRKINLQFEINYSEKGSRKNPKTDEGDTDFFLMRLNYIEVPMMMRFKKRNFTYEGGFYIGQLIGDHLEDENGVYDIPPPLRDFNQNDVGFLLGLNYNFTDNLIMNWRFSNSLVNFRQFDSGGRLPFDSGLIHHYLSFNFRYEFLGKDE